MAGFLIHHLIHRRLGSSLVLLRASPRVCQILLSQSCVLSTSKKDMPNKRRVHLWSVPSSEVTKCDTRLVTHLVHQMVHCRTTRRGCGNGSATATRTNIRTVAHVNRQQSKECFCTWCCVRAQPKRWERWQVHVCTYTWMTELAGWWFRNKRFKRSPGHWFGNTWIKKRLDFWRNYG
jgi:hypothetical protein